MKISFDRAKNAINIAKHGLSLTDFVRFDGAYTVAVDDRYDYGEV